MKMQTEGDEAVLLAHHQQQPLCSSRPAYRQGRRLTAVKVYTVATESNHILIFGVPALKLRQEIKALFIKFGKLIKFNLSPEHPSEPFTETYHAHYEKMQSARQAKRMLDTKNFYGGSLHVCYAPELETIEETREKLMQRQKDVTYRLWSLKRADKEVIKTIPVEETNVKVKETRKMNMGEVNIISSGDAVKVKRKKVPKKFKQTANGHKIQIEAINKHNEVNKTVGDSCVKINKDPVIYKPAEPATAVEVVDCTSADKEVITNINEHLNYDKFGNEDVRKVATRPVNKIVFCFNKK